MTLARIYLESGVRLPIAAAVRAAICFWLLFNLAHLLTGSRYWWWAIPDSAPTFLYLLVPAILLCAVPLISRAPWTWAAAAGLSLAIGINNTDVRLRYLPDGACRTGSAGDPVRILTWNTQFWGEKHPGSELGAEILKADADIVALQEVQVDIRKTYVNWTPPDFPSESFGTVIRKGELALATNFVVKRENSSDRTTPFLWADIALPAGPVVRVVNVHIPLHLSLTFQPGDGDFFDFIKARSVIRNRNFEALQTIVQNSPNPVIVLGDFNSTTAMRAFRRGTEGLCDSIHAAARGNAMTWSRFGLFFWRPDYVLTSPDISVQAHEVRTMGDISDHRGILVSFSMQPR